MESFKAFSNSYATDVDRFVGKCLMMITYTHVAHFMTKSYAQHMALGDFYDSLQDLVDKFAEVYIGTGKPYRPVLQVDPTFDVIKSIRGLIEDANKVRVMLNESALENIVDEIKALAFQTLYKLENLS